MSRPTFTSFQIIYKLQFICDFRLIISQHIHNIPCLWFIDTEQEKEN